jgi:hypothetical protein
MIDPRTVVLARAYWALSPSERAEFVAKLAKRGETPRLRKTLPRCTVCERRAASSKTGVCSQCERTAAKGKR